MPISNVHKSVIVVYSIETRFSTNVFEVVQKNSRVSFFRSATQVRPRRAGLGTGWVTCCEYPVAKVTTLSFLFSFI